MLIDRTKVGTPVLPKETVTVPGLDGDVIVRGLMLTERISLESQIQSVVADGEDAAQLIVPRLLALTVLDKTEQPVFTSEQWQSFGSVYYVDACALFNVAMKLSGFNKAADIKN